MKKKIKENILTILYALIIAIIIRIGVDSIVIISVLSKSIIDLNRFIFYHFVLTLSLYLGGSPDFILSCTSFHPSPAFFKAPPISE